MAIRKALAAAFVALALCGCTCTLAGCGSAEAEQPTRSTRFTFSTADEDGLISSLFVVTDTETGCQYLCWERDDSGGMELLVDKYGNPLLANGYSRVEVGMSDDDGE